MGLAIISLESDLKRAVRDNPSSNVSRLYIDEEMVLSRDLPGYVEHCIRRLRKKAAPSGSRNCESPAGRLFHYESLASETKSWRIGPSVPGKDVRYYPPFSLAQVLYSRRLANPQPLCELVCVDPPGVIIVASLLGLDEDISLPFCKAG